MRHHLHCMAHEASLALGGSWGITCTAWLMRQHLHCVAHEPSLASDGSWAITGTAWLMIIYKSYDSCTIEVLSQYNQIRLTPKYSLNALVYNFVVFQWTLLLVSYLAKDQSHRHGVHIPCTPLWQWIPTASIININPTVRISTTGMWCAMRTLWIVIEQLAFL